MLPKQLLTKIGISSILLLAGSLLSPASASEIPSYVEGTDAAAVVYNPLEVNNFDIQMSEADINKLVYPTVSWDNEGPWLRAVVNFTMADKVYGPYTVGVHLKGAWGSWRDINGKAGFKIKMDAFTKNQTLFGVTKFTLNNMVQDPSLIHEAITYRLFRAMGVPTPRIGYANVYLNGRNYGLHLNVETIDTTMITRWGLENKHLYKGGVPNFPDFYPGYEPYFAVEDGSTTNHADLTNFIRINQKTGDAWWTEITQYADIQEIMTDFATEAYVGHWDGYPYNHNNFFITFDSAGYAHMIPWGTDQTWGGGMDYFGSGTLLFQRCQSSTDCRELYLQALAKVARTAKALELDKMATYVGTAIQEAAAADPWGPGAQTAHDYQSWAIGTINNQQAYLASITHAWDTGVEKVSVEGEESDSAQTIVLPAGTKATTVQAIPYQEGATSAPVSVSALKSGHNFVEIQVTSADGQHESTHVVQIYVLTNRTASAQLSFTPGKATIVKTSNTKLSQLNLKLRSSTGLTIKFSMPKAKTLSWAQAKALLDKRASMIVNNIRAKGIKVVKFTKVIIPTGNASDVKLSLQYQN